MEHISRHIFEVLVCCLEEHFELCSRDEFENEAFVSGLEERRSALPARDAPLVAAAQRLDERRANHPALGRVAIAGATLSYGLEYFRGVREEAGSLPKTWLHFARHAVAQARQKRQS